MCGFIGVITNRDRVDSLSHYVESGLNQIEHRGPDEKSLSNYQCDKSNDALIFGHVRLSILDLNNGHQPFESEDKNVSLIYNGEIYNYVELRDELISLGQSFKENSDTEVVLKAYLYWGVDSFIKLRGMFSLAIWDSRSSTLLLARDRFGKKPLFYSKIPEGLGFCSEIKGLLELPSVDPSMNKVALSHYYKFRYVPSPYTLFEGIYKLPPGHYATFTSGKLVVSEYCNLADGTARQKSQLPKDPVDKFLSLFEESVKIRMRSDVSYGAFLSGGLDSSAIVAMMANLSSKPVKTYSVGFEDNSYSELKYARQVADAFNTDHHELVITSDDFINNIERLIAFRDAPISEPSDIAIYLLAREARKSVKMVLTGEGSDEVLGGYPKHVFERFHGLYALVPGFLRNQVVSPVVDNLPYRFRRIKTAISSYSDMDCRDRFPRWFGALNDEGNRNVCVEEFWARKDSALDYCFSCDDTNSSLRNILYFDQKSWLPDNLLERGDRMTMAASLEARMPFLDHELVDFVSTLPDSCRVRGTSTKWILREAMKRLLPKEILARPKVGFRIPVNDWFRGELKDYVYSMLLGKESKSVSFYHLPALRDILDQHSEGKRNHEKLIWTLLNLEIWCRQYI